MESASKKEVTNFGNLIIKVTSYYLYHILFIRLKSLVPAHTKGEKITQGCEYQEVKITEGHLISLPTIAIASCVSLATFLNLSECQFSPL